MNTPQETQLLKAIEELTETVARLEGMFDQLLEERNQLCAALKAALEGKPVKAWA